MNGVMVDKQIRFVLQVGKTVMDGDKDVAEDIETALRDYGFKDAQILGVVAIRDDDPDPAIAEELPRDDFKADTVIENMKAKAGSF